MSSQHVIVKNPDGTLGMTETAVFSCGCSGVVPDARNKLRMAGVGNVPLVMTNINDKARKYIRQVGLNIVAPGLSKSTHSVLYNPKTGQFIDLLKAPNNGDVYANIAKVVNG